MSKNRTIDLNAGEFDERFLDAPLWRLRAVVDARQVKETEYLDTFLDNGIIESTREVPVGHWIVTVPNGDEYPMNDETFQERYDAIGNGKYQAKGLIRAYSNPTGENVEITAPWGKKQSGDRHCYFATLIGDNFEPTNDRYLIGLDEFEETYKWDEVFNILVPLKNAAERQATLATKEG